MHARNRARFVNISSSSSRCSQASQLLETELAHTISWREDALLL